MVREHRRHDGLASGKESRVRRVELEHHVCHGVLDRLERSISVAAAAFAVHQLLKRCVEESAVGRLDCSQITHVRRVGKV
jgi:hypothetical protein